MNQYYNLAKGVFLRFLRGVVYASISAIAVYWTAHLGDVLPIWMLTLLGPALTGALLALDKWARAKMSGN